MCVAFCHIMWINRKYTYISSLLKLPPTSHIPPSMSSQSTGLRSIQFSSVSQSCPTLCDLMNCSRPGFPVHHQILELAQTHVHWVSDTIQLSHPQSSPSLPALNLSQHQGFYNESVLHIRWPKYWSFIFSISPSSEYSGPISLRMDWLDFLAGQGTLKRLLQNHSSKALIL